MKERDQMSADKRWATATNRFSSTLVIIAVGLFLFVILVAPASCTLNGTETVLTTDVYKSAEYPPSISGDQIVWSTPTLDDGSGGTYRMIILTNLSTGDEYPLTPVTSPVWQTAPSIDRNIAIWLEDDTISTNIAAFNLTTQSRIAEINVTPGPSPYYLGNPDDNVLPKISGNITVWQDYSHGNWDIFLYNLTWVPGSTPDEIIADPGFDENKPAIFGDYIVYQNWSSGSSKIYLYFISNGTAVKISNSIGDDINPQVDAFGITWEGTDPGTSRQCIYYSNLSTKITRQITPVGSLFDQRNPSLDGDSIAVIDYRHPHSDIYLYDTVIPGEKLLTPSGTTNQGRPVVDAGRVVWDSADETGSFDDVHVITLGSGSESCPVADFTIDNPVDPAGGTVHLTDISGTGTSPTLFRFWNFSDGSQWENDSALVTTHSHTFGSDGTYHIRLTTGNEKCRNITPDLSRYWVFINSSPIANFSESVTEGLAPLTVTFTDTSAGSPTHVSWDFGDGSPNVNTSPVSHTFMDIGRVYNVTLNATNSHGSSNTTMNIRTLMGAQGFAQTPIPGITIDGRFGGSFLMFNSSELPDFSPAVPSSRLDVFPPAVYGWQNISFISSDPTGIVKFPLNTTYSSNISRIILMTNDTIASTTGMSTIGNKYSINYRLNTSSFPNPGSVQITTREGISADDLITYNNFAANLSPNSSIVRSTAFSFTITKLGVSREGISAVNLSINESWVQGGFPTPADGRNYLYLLAYGYDSQGRKCGALLPYRYLFTFDNREYLEANIPEQLSFLSNFTLAKLSGSGNPFQLITLTIAAHVNQGSSSAGSPSYSSGGGSSSPPPPSPVQTPVPPDAEKTIKLYSNPNGIISQQSILFSADNRVNLTIGTGILALDSTGKPLTNVTIKALPAGKLPSASPGNGLVFAGMAYDFMPDGATFSPGITASFRIPDPGSAGKYAVKSYNRAAGVWEDLPATFDPATGALSTRIPHFCCIALFSQSLAGAPVQVTPAITPVVIPSVTTAPSVPPTAISIVSGMVFWVSGLLAKNPIAFAAGVILVISLVFFRYHRMK